MSKIIISPFSRVLRNNTAVENHPKNYPYWPELIKILKEKNYTVYQVGVNGEPVLDVHQCFHNMKLTDLKTLLLETDTWVSVDNFFNHFATYYKKPGVVIFATSDPKHFGYDQNINLLKDEKYLRKFQFDIWEKQEFVKEAFVEPQTILEAIDFFLQKAQGKMI